MIQTSHAGSSVEQQRAQARLLLDALVASQRSNDGVSIDALAVPAEGSMRRDLFKRVTGHSSLENAINATRRAIEAYDRMLGGPGDPPAMPTIRVTAAGRVTATGVPSVL
ncbi:MAG: hypothetical protein NTV94_15085 [Planctomycetota bacterium]|nr:hypothetical protein [Planctomycetota bacterium]